MKYEKITLKDTELIIEMSEMATRILKEHYDPIVGEEKNSYMLRKFQSVPAIVEQLHHGYQYYFVIDEDNNKVGFVAFYPVENKLYLSKFYLEKCCRGKGIAKDMLNFVIENAKGNALTAIFLHVNIHNSTVHIYEKMGFKRIREEKREIGDGYFVDDYVYEYIVE